MVKNIERGDNMFEDGHVDPLDRFMVKTPSSERESGYDDDRSMHRENSATLGRLRDLLSAAERSLTSISSALVTDNAAKLVRLPEPSYLDDNFDRDLYIKQLVHAKINGFQIVQDCTLTKLVDLGDRYRMDTSKPRGPNTQIIRVDGGTKDVVAPRQNVSGGKLTFNVLAGINIRSQLTEQKFPVVDIKPSEVDNQTRKSTNVAYVHSIYGMDEKCPIEHEDTIESIKESPPKSPVAVEETMKNIDPQVAADSSYLFIDRPQSMPRINRRPISRLKKFGIPEISRIYAPPRQSFVPRKHFHHDRVSDYRFPLYAATTSKYPEIFEHKPNEYIPYSKLTVGGLKADDAEKYLKTPNKQVQFDGHFIGDNPKSNDNTDDTLKKIKSLNMRHKPETFDYVHRLETRDMSTQSNENLVKATQTSPKQEERADVDSKQITLADMLRLEKTISNFNSKLSVNEAVESETKTRHVQTSPVKRVDKPASPIGAENARDAQTSPIATKKNEDSSSGRSRVVSIKVRPRRGNVTVSSDTLTDASRSEVSDACSIGEINFTLLRKKIVTVLRHSNAAESSSSSGEVHFDSTVSSQKSEGEARRK